MLATFSAPGGDLVKCYRLLCCVGVCFRFFRYSDSILAPFRRYFCVLGTFLGWFLEVFGTMMALSPTSPLGLGGLGWGVCFYVALTLWGEVYLSPYPLSLAPGRSGPAVW